MFEGFGFKVASCEETSQQMWKILAVVYKEIVWDFDLLSFFETIFPRDFKVTLVVVASALLFMSLKSICLLWFFKFTIKWEGSRWTLSLSTPSIPPFPLPPAKKWWLWWKFSFLHSKWRWELIHVGSGRDMCFQMENFMMKSSL